MLPQFSSMENASCIQIRDLTFCYAKSDRPACQIGKLEIAKGECLVLCGASGSGKSTVLQLLNGLIPDYTTGCLKGQAILKDYRLGQASVEDLSTVVASVFQNPATQFFHQRVIEELVFPCENQGLPHQEIERRLSEIVDLFDIEALLDKELQALSGGQKQLVALATAAMQGTDILVLDEPTANLDQLGVERVAAVLGRLKAMGKTLIVAEHRLAYLSQLADRYLYFQDGALLKGELAADFLQQSEEERQQRGLRCLHREPYQEQLSSLITKEQVGEAGLEISQLTVCQGGQVLYRIPQLYLASGQVIGLVGANGSGKSTLAAYLAGLKEDSQSQISWQGQILSARQRLEKTALVMQDVRLQLFSETVKKELVLGRKKSVWDPALVSAFRLEDLLDRHPVSLSGGEQQRVMIVASLLAEKEIVIFDEPSSGLDLEQMEQLAKALWQVKQRGRLVLLISHDEELLARVCDTIIDITHFPQPPAS